MPTVLIIIESNPLQNTLLRAIAHNFAVTACNNAASAAVLLTSEPDALILDLSSIGSDGLAFLSQHESQLPPVVLVLSCVTSPDVLLHLSRLPVDAVIRIPCTAAEVVRRLNECFLAGSI